MYLVHLIHRDPYDKILNLSLISKHHPFIVLKKYIEAGVFDIALANWKKLDENDIEVLKNVFPETYADLNVVSESHFRYEGKSEQ